MRGHVALSEDYGSTWIQAEGVPTRATLTAVSMIGSNIWAVGHDTTIIHSSDNGQTWTKQFEDVEREMPLLDVLFINESEGFAVGAYGTYLTTYDGGKNWNDGLISEDEDYHLNKIIKVDEFKYFVVAESVKHIVVLTQVITGKVSIYHIPAQCLVPYCLGTKL